MPYPGQDKDTPIPKHLDKWNWGAFCLNYIWGVGNSSYRAFLIIIPIYGLYVFYQLGKYGSRWAWKNRLWADEAHFVRTQRNWARASLLVIGLAIPIFILLPWAVVSIFHNNDAVKSSMTILRSDPVSIEKMGEPIETGFWISGSIQTGGGNGGASLRIPITGPKCGGHAMMEATKTYGLWTVNSLIVTLECDPTPRELLN